MRSTERQVLRRSLGRGAGALTSSRDFPAGVAHAQQPAEMCWKPVTRCQENSVGKKPESLVQVTGVPVNQGTGLACPGHHTSALESGSGGGHKREEGRDPGGGQREEENA